MVIQKETHGKSAPDGPDMGINKSQLKHGHDEYREDGWKDWEFQQKMWIYKKQRIS